MEPILALQALEIPNRRDTIVFEGSRYYTVEGALRMGARGSVNIYDFDPDPSLSDSGLGVYKFQRYRDVKTHLMDAGTKLIGSGDVWYLSPKRYSPPNLIYSNEDVVEIPAGEWYSRLRSETLVFDWHVITHAHGKEGGGRGKTERAASIELETVKLDGMDASYLKILSANSVGDYKDTGEYVSKKPMMDLTLSVHQPVYAAGRSFVFSTREAAQAASDAGLIGRMPIDLTLTVEEDDALYSIQAVIEETFGYFSSEFASDVAKDIRKRVVAAKKEASHE